MAYGERWYIEDTNPETDNVWKASIQERDYLGSATELIPDQSFIRIAYKPIDKFKNSHVWHVASSTCTLHYIDDGTGLLSDILNGDDEKYQVVITEDSSTRWTGLVQPDSFSHNLYTLGPASITASDRLETLKSRPYMESDDVFYAGRTDVQEILYKLLAKTGLSVGMNTHVQITPFLTSNPIDPATDDLLESLRLDQDAFLDADGLAYSCMYVLEQILTSLNLQLFQAEGEWVIAHRRRELSGSNYVVYTYNSTNTVSSTLNITANETVDLASGNLFIEPVAGGTPPSGKVTSIYYHGDPFTGVFTNLGFDDAGLRETVTGTPLVNGASQTGTTLDIDGITTPSTIPVGYRFTISGDTTEYRTTEAALVTAGAATLTITPELASSPADNAALTFYESKGGWEIDDTIASATITRSSTRAQDGTFSLRIDTKYQASGASAETTYLTDSATQTGIYDVGGGAGIRHRIIMWVSANDIVDLASGNTLNLYFDYKVGSYFYDHQNGTWETTQPDSYLDLVRASVTDSGFTRFEFFTPALLDGSTPIDGTPEIILRNAVEGNDAGGSTQTYVYIDAIEIVQIDENGEPSAEATRNTVFNEGNVNRYELPEPVLIIGEGPTSAHIGRYTVLDSTGAEVETETSWAWGESDDTEIGLEAYVLNEKLKQVRNARRLITCAVASQGSNPPTPLQQLVIENPHNTDSSTYMWNALQWHPLNPLGILQGDWAEVVVGESADKFCSYSIQPDSLAVKGLEVENGLTCSDGDPIFFPGNDFTHVYALTRGGLADGAVVKFERDDGDVGSGTWTETSLATFTTSGTDVQFMRVDETAEYIFTVVLTSGDWDLYRHDLDGSNPAVIYSSALSDEVTGMDIDRVGQYIWLTRASTSAGYLTRIDYSGNDSDVYTISKAGSGSFNGAMWDRSTKCYFFEYEGTGPTMYLYSYDTTTESTSLEFGSYHTGFGSDRKYGVGSAARGYLLFNPLTGSNNDSIAKLDLLANGSMSYPVTSPNAVERGCAINWNTQNYFYAPGSGQVNRKNIDGTGDTHVATASSGDDIYDLCVGV